MSAKKLHQVRHHVLICEGKSCSADGADKVAKRIKETAKDLDKDDEILITRTSCTGQCGKGPIVIVYPDGVWYREVSPKIGSRIVSEHICNGEIIENRLLVDLQENSEL